MTTTYVTCTDAAKLLRAALKRAFPTVKFGVRSKSYAGGASIRISWTDGPSSKRVEEIAARFEGASFDGMIDLESPNEQLVVDETGTLKSVHYGSKYVFCSRSESPGLKDACLALFKSRWHVEQWAKMPSYEHERMVWRGVSAIDIPQGEALEVTAARAFEAYVS